MGCFFAMAAYVQLNDPDVLLWMFIYAIPGCLCISIAFSPEVQEHHIWQTLATADIVGSLAGAIYLAAVIRPQMQKGALHNPLVLEEGREMSGLIIIIFWISLCKFVSWYCQRKGDVPVSFWISILVLCFVPFSLWAYCYRNLDPKILPGHCKDML
ncbi:transmembrane protein 220-like [Dendronephthya gigantea]|uniref:transmembrane protein 220-like n=1 Tax=Dendronephthya gigantea TaxID=151771 RepID=UPI001069F24C|nr:transmembrane protein 220-like [Dendronephthya gigantea]